MLRLTILISSAILLAACDRDPPEPVRVPFADPGVSLTVTQVSAGCTTEGNYRARVEWQVPETVSPHLDVRVDKARTLFAASDRRRDSNETGDWVKPGLVFYLTQREDSKIIAATPAAPGNCGPDSVG